MSYANQDSNVRFPGFTQFLLIVYFLITIVTLGFAATCVYFNVQAYQLICAELQVCIPQIYEIYAIATGVAFVAFLQALVQVVRYNRWSGLGTAIVVILWIVVFVLGWSPGITNANASVQTDVDVAGNDIEGWFREAWADMVLLTQNHQPLDANTTARIGFIILSCISIGGALILTIFALFNHRSRQDRIRPDYKV